MRAPERVAAPWQSGRLDGRSRAGTLLFGRMHEDWSIEASVFPPGGRVLCIASAGCTAMALASRGDRVTAVDINPAQVAYVRARLAGAPPTLGRVERLLQTGRRAVRWLGWNETDLRAFLMLESPIEQARFWRERLDTGLWKAALRCVLHPFTLRIAYASCLLRALPPRFDRVVRRRLERGWANHSNRANPYAWRLLLGYGPPEEDSTTQSAKHPEVSLICADVADYLEHCGPASFDAFSLSNILDGAEPQYRERLLLAVRRAAAPEALLVLRSFAEPQTEDEDSLAARDRALLWGSVRLLKVCSAEAGGYAEPGDRL